MWTCLLVICLASGTLLAQTAGEFRQQADQLIRENKWEEARNLLQTGLEQYPDDSEILVQLGSLLVRSGRVAEGDSLLRKALDLQPHNARALRAAGEAQLRRGQVADAIALFEDSLEQNSQDGESRHRLAFARLAQGEEGMALEHARQAVEVNPLEPRYRRLYALLLDLEGQIEQSYQQLKIAYRLAPEDPKLLFQLSQKRQLSGELFQALEYLELAIETDPENPLYHDQLASLYLQLGEQERAEEEREKTRALQQAFEQYLAALKLSTQGHRARAVAMLEPVIREHPQFVTGKMLLADLYHQDGRQDSALDLYMEILKLDPSQSEAREKGAWIQVRQGFLESALQLLEESSQPSLNRFLIAGYQKMARGDWKAALQHFYRVEKLNPLNPGLLQLIGFCLNAQGQGEEALRYLAKARKIRPGDDQIRLQILDTRLDKAFALFRHHRWESALKSFQELLREEVRVDYLLHIAYCHQQLGHLDQAIRQYRTALEIDPDASWARFNLASCLYLQGQYQEAAKQLERVLRTSQTAESYFRLGLCYSHLNRYPEAERLLEKAMKMGTQSPEILYSLGLARLHNGKMEGTWALIRRSAAAGFPPARELLAKAPRY